MDKGTVSNCISAAILGLSFFLPEGAARAVILSAGLFALSGGVTNWLAVKMLFDRIPGLVGSGIIPARFREIRAEIKDLIVTHFFSEKDLREFFETNAKDVEWSRYLKKREGANPAADLVMEQWQKLTSADVMQPLIDAQIDKLTQSSIGGMLLMVGLDNVRPAVNQFVTSFVGSMQEKVVAAAKDVGGKTLPLELDHDRIIADLQVQVEPLLEQKLQQLHAEDVKKMMEDVMRKHLGWLIVWGNVFGGLIGVAAHFLQRAA